ncbi:MAG TPA: hypothetical protein EYP67_00150 [Methanosarcinales archaeon]|nr:hypothetical protein [Methanosarcinales archaeon]
MNRADQNVLGSVNIPGVIAGMMTLILPFLGAWWHLTIGVDAIVVNASPFEVRTIILGNGVTSPLFEWFCLGLKLGVMYLGVLLIAGSALPAMGQSEGIARIFIRFASKKLFWLVLIFVASLIIFIALANQSATILPFQVHLPYLVGTKTVSANMENMSITVPISMKLTSAFGVAVVAAIIGIYSRITQKNM